MAARDDGIIKMVSEHPWTSGYVAAVVTLLLVIEIVKGIR